MSSCFWAVLAAMGEKRLNISDQLFSGVAFSTYCSIHTKKLHNISCMKNEFWFIFELFLNFFVPQNRLPLKLNRECKAQRGFIDCLYTVWFTKFIPLSRIQIWKWYELGESYGIIPLGLFRLLYERGFFILMYCDLLTKKMIS